MSRQFISLVTIVVPDYQSGINFYVEKLGFRLKEDTPQSDGKRWVRVGPDTGEVNLLLAKAVTPEQMHSIGNQTGGRVGFFLTTDAFNQDYVRLKDLGIEFLETPRTEDYGKVVVFVDPFGNKWDLIEPCLE